MTFAHIPFQQVPQFSKRDRSYVLDTEQWVPFVEWTPEISSFTKVIEDRKSFSNEKRTLLVQALNQQYMGYLASSEDKALIQSLLTPNTFTVVTAHQPSLFTGPAYYIYKIVSVINLAKALKDAHPDATFVPVFISGAEDHDFEEINHLSVYGKSVTWSPKTIGGAVGRLSVDGITQAIDEVEVIVGQHDFIEDLRQIYATTDNYGQAAIHLVHRLFSKYGLLVLSMDDPLLKRAFIPIMEKEIFEQTSQILVQNTQTLIQSLGFEAQAHAREINFFYLEAGKRSRIILEDGLYKVLERDVTFSEAELRTELHAHPERFSPNVVTRPLYQEFTLPNLAYVGGGGEIAYWLERKTQFRAFGMKMPILIRRNSALWMDKGSLRKMEKLGWKPIDLFQENHKLTRSYIEEAAEGELSLATEKEAIKNAFLAIQEKAASVDLTLSGAVEAEMTRQIKAVEQLESRIMRAEKQKHQIAIQQTEAIKEKLFPGGGLQERKESFLGPYMEYGDAYLDQLFEAFDPLDSNFTILLED